MRYFILFFISVTVYSKVFIELPAKKIEYFIIGNGDKKITVIGGIHGNEIGGYMSAGFLKKLKVYNATILVIPRANPISIIANQRAYNGDMNKKFDDIIKHDKDYKYVSKIEELILKFMPHVLLSLHDGYGFAVKEKKAWGQSIVIDEDKYKSFNLLSIAEYVRYNANKFLRYKVAVKNTHTFSKPGSYNKNGLTGWSLKHGIMAFSLESSKNIPLKERMKTHLLMIKYFFQKFGIKSNIDYLINHINPTFKKPVAILNVNNKIIKINKTSIIEVPKDAKVKFINLNKEGFFISPRGVDKNWSSFYFKDVTFDVMYMGKKIYSIRIKEKPF